MTALVIGSAGYLICLGAGMVRYILMMAVYFAGLGLVNVIRNALKKRKVSSGVNKVFTFAFSFVFFSLFYSVIIWATLGLTDSKIFTSDSETYEYRGDTFTAYHDELPLTVGDLLGISNEGYSMRLRGSMTPLAQKTEGSQEPRLDAEDAMEMPGLDYTVTKISIPALYEWCRDDLIREKQDTVVDDELVYLDVWERSDASPWKAEEAYRRLRIEGYSNEYLLFYSDRIIEIRFSWEPDEQQMQTAAEKLLAGQ